MKPEFELTPGIENKKKAWLQELASFIVEANNNTWAVNAPEIEPKRPDYKEPQPYQKGDWELDDSYTGYFRAPGMTTVYYKKRIVWTMQYGGHGQTEGSEYRAKQTFEFLKSALTQVSPELPFRGPKEYIRGSQRYNFTLLEGDITDCLWREEIYEDNYLTFTQTGLAGIVIHKDKDQSPLYPWDL